MGNCARRRRGFFPRGTAFENLGSHHTTSTHAASEASTSVNTSKPRCFPRAVTVATIEFAPVAHFVAGGGDVGFIKSAEADSATQFPLSIADNTGAPPPVLGQTSASLFAPMWSLSSAIPIRIIVVIIVLRTATRGPRSDPPVNGIQNGRVTKANANHVTTHTTNPPATATILGQTPNVNTWTSTKYRPVPMIRIGGMCAQSSDHLNLCGVRTGANSGLHWRHNQIQSGPMETRMMPLPLFTDLLHLAHVSAISSPHTPSRKLSPTALSSLPFHALEGCIEPPTNRVAHPLLRCGLGFLGRVVTAIGAGTKRVRIARRRLELHCVASRGRCNSHPRCWFRRRVGVPPGTCADHLSSANIRTKTPTPTDRALRVLIVSPSLLLLHRQRRFPHRGQVRHLFHRRGNRSSGCCAPFHLASKSGRKVVTQGALFSGSVIQQSARGASLRSHSSRLRAASRRGSLINSWSFSTLLRTSVADEDLDLNGCVSSAGRRGRCASGLTTSVGLSRWSRNP